VLEDGSVFTGWSFAGDGEVAGEVVFTTSMVGYQETITDPSYRGQIVLFTYPLIGNYGMIPGDEESRDVQAAAVLVREYTPYHSNWASEESLAATLDRAGVLGIEGMDTRALTRRIRDKGAMRGVISTVERDPTAAKGEGERPPLDGRPRPRLLGLRPHRTDPHAGLRRGAVPDRSARLRGKGLHL
jgi:carbamoyl-phosphate synthase small subunit